MNSEDRRSPLPTLKIVLLVYGTVSLVVLGMFIVVNQREKSVNPSCTNAQVEVDLTDIVPDGELELSTPQGGVCVGDVIYEGPELCQEWITLFETVADSIDQDSVQFRLDDCVLSVEKITRR